MNWDTIFRVGTHTAGNGITQHWDRQALDRLAANLDPDVPVVIHHPADQTQAAEFGKIAEICRIGDRLVAKYKDVPETLKKAVSEGLRLAKSVSIDPATMKIKHLGLLGADQPPAVDGLGSVNFSAVDKADTGGQGLLTYTLNHNKEGEVDPKDKEIQELKDKIKTLETGKQKEKLQGELDQAQKDLKTEQDAHQATREEFSKFKNDQETRALEARVDALAESGRILPADKEKTLAYAQALPGEKKTMDFSADGKTEKVSPRESYLRELEARQPDRHGLLSEFAQGSGAGRDQEESLDLSGLTTRV